MNGESFNNQNIYVEDLAAKKPSKGYAIASLVLGIVSLVCCCSTAVSLVCSILAIIFAVLFRRDNGSFGGMATAGLVCGVVSLALGAFSFAVTIFNPLTEAELNALLEQYMAMLEQMAGETEGGAASVFRALFR